MDKAGEIWKPIKGFEGYYAVSNLGNIKSIERIVNPRAPRVVPEKIMQWRYDMKGYPRICLYKKGKSIDLYIHRLVAIAFIENPKNFPLVMHLDDNPKNSYYKNLKWGDCQMNTDLKVAAGRQCRGEGHYSAKLTNNIVRKIRRLYNTSKLSQRAIGQMLGVNYKRVNKVVHNKIWKHII